MKPILLALTYSLVTAGAAADDLAAKIDRAVAAELAKQRIPGAAVAVLRGNDIVLAKGYGSANLEHNVPVTPDTMFQAGSVGKQFTAAAVMLLAEDGKLSLDDPIVKHLPDAPHAWSNITLRHLLTHTSGIPDYTPELIDYRKDYTEQELARVAYTLKREFAPGARWNYSNTAYVLLGAVIRAASGKFYGDFLRERLFAPAGMKTARIISEEDIVPHRAAGYRLAGEEIKNQEWVAPTLNTTADGSLYVSLNDMIAWARTIRGRRVLKGETWDSAFTPVKLNSGNTWPYGFGWDVAPLNGLRRVEHGGAWQGFKAFISRFPDEDVTIIALANLANARPEEIVHAAAGAVDARFVPRPLVPIADEDPAMTARALALLDAARLGRLDPADFAYVRAGFFPEAANAYAKRLQELGPVKLQLLKRERVGDDVVSTYQLTGEKGTARLMIAVAPDGKIAQFGLR